MAATVTSSTPPVNATPTPSAQQQPAAIVRLDDSVVHRIAAGEVVQRPASALKEMLENSLDAGAKHITVVVKEGGLKYLQIQDDGCGIRVEDLPILCHRHTTSKLRAYEDLDTIATLGFRGEALSSISYVSHVTVTTMTANMLHGYRVQYSDGDMLPPGPKPVAAVPGSSIIVEDMFYNMLPRRKAFRPGPEEHNLLQDVVQRYAIYKAGSVGFTLKRQGEARSDLHTLPSAARLDVIRMLFGPDLAANLLPLQLSAGSGDVSKAVQLDGPMAFTAAGFVSNLTHVGRKSVLILFINGRPVEQGQLKRAIEAVYTAQNPKASKPWVFLDLKMPPRHVEVNVHPTKKEVGFLHQQDVIDNLCCAVEQLLMQSMNSRTFSVNKAAALTAAVAPATPAGPAQAAGDPNAAEAAAAQATGIKDQHQRRRPNSASNAAGTQQPTQSTYRPEKLVRTDHRTQSLDGFLVSQASAAALASAAAPVPTRRRTGARKAGTPGAAEGLPPGASTDLHDAAPAERFSNASLHLQAAAAEQDAATAELQEAAAAGSIQQQQHRVHSAGQPMMLLRAARQPKLPEVATQLSSVRELLLEVQSAAHGELEQVLRNHTWVGMADDRLVLLQHSTQLYLVDVGALSQDLFYQLLLTRWQSCQVMQLAKPLPVQQLMAAALQLEEAAGRWQAGPGASKQELCGLVEALLAQKAEMLAEYTGLMFSCPSGQVSTPAARDQQQQQQQQALCLTGIPLLLDGYVPDLSLLPQLVMRLARDVDWESEKECFKSLADVVAEFYSLHPLLLSQQQQQQQRHCQQVRDGNQGPQLAGTAVIKAATASNSGNEEAENGAQPMDVDDQDCQQKPDSNDTSNGKQLGMTSLPAVAGVMGPHRDQQQREWLLRHVLMPAIKYMYKPPRERARDGSVLLLTSMQKLYRVFERCGW